MRHDPESKLHPDIWWQILKLHIIDNRRENVLFIYKCIFLQQYIVRWFQIDILDYI